RRKGAKAQRRKGAKAQRRKGAKAQRMQRVGCGERSEPHRSGYAVGLHTPAQEREKLIFSPQITQIFTDKE
ncbi:hypothetical protein, partial [Candidatus Thiosymbion oneisti]|uniref:hypothetical protein n=1 Tax=Candidatus Thiosymbion oneisti TaxID=589554 RepID=UPI001C4089B7